ncbi:UNVERIFIED_ORG: hypothetical protein QE446_005108 [Rhizobium sp. SORGH_AS260]|nr:hypothetical protein [Rhizobium sp. SORGH_AS_0285]MDP9757184.1 hypothetical protein [Rhizobium sp. SORGH_AS_0260]MDR6084077.1 hypothetical protein [Agrobacterium sp. SORGH_AS_0440]
MSAMHTGFTEVNSASNPMDQTTQNAAMVEQSSAAFNALALRSREPAELDCAVQSARLSGRHCARWVAQWCLRSLIPLPRAPPTAKDRGIWLARSEQLPLVGFTSARCQLCSYHHLGFNSGARCHSASMCAGTPTRLPRAGFIKQTLGALATYEPEVIVDAIKLLRDNRARTSPSPDAGRHSGTDNVERP